MPIVLSALVLQWLTNFGFIEVDYALKEDRAVFAGVQKLFAVALSVVMAILSVWAGVYGDVGVAQGFLLVLQLTFGSIIVILLDEVIQKGYGFGTGISLFVGVSACQNVMWKLLSFSRFQTGKGTEYEGAIVGFFHLLMTRRDKFRALKEAFYRVNLPNVWNVLVTIAAALATIYVQGFRVDIAVKSNRARGQQGIYPIRLLYTSNMPLVIVSTVVAFGLYVAHALFRRFPDNFFIRLLGVWESVDGASQEIVSGGLAYYVTPPHSIFAALLDPLHFVVYLGAMLFACATVAQVWTEVSGTSSRDVAHTLKAQGLSIAGHREASISKELKRVIPIAASLGGLLVAALAIATDLLGGLGSGVGIVLAVTSIYQYFEIIVREQYDVPEGFF
ncbi:hypothetical protein HK405_006036 [Cladochytrium tenue]|nr:hypothetical protein HK405_006036 [Cladochytrium tenue]